jgi:hypothetical protein
MIKVIKTSRFPLFALAILCLNSVTLNGETTERRLSYTVNFEGYPAGKLSTIDGYVDGSHTTTITVGEINLEPLGEDFRLVINSEVTWADTSPTGFDHFFIGNEERWHLKGETHGPDMIITAAKVRTPDEIKNRELMGLAGLVAANTIPYADAAMTVLGLFGNEEPEGEWAIPLKGIELTDLELVEHLMALPEWKGQKKLVVFLTEAFEEQKLKVTCMPDETVEVPAGQFPCRVFKIKAKEGIATYWITDDEQYGIMTVKETGKEDGIRYEVKLDSAEMES